MNPANMMMHQFVLMAAAFAIGIVLMLGIVLFLLYKFKMAGMVLKGVGVPGVLIDTANSAASQAGAPAEDDEKDKKKFGFLPAKCVIQ